MGNSRNVKDPDEWQIRLRDRRIGENFWRRFS